MSLNHRYEAVLLFDVRDGNPNGDPDADNMPRTDIETGQGLITDVCQKRKIRDYVSLVKESEPGFEIYVRNGAILNNEHDRAYQALNITEEDIKKVKGSNGKKKPGSENLEKVRNWMTQNFYDIRTFGAVMSTNINAGQVRGPVQMTFARSIDPVEIQEHGLTRKAITKPEDENDKENTMGRKYTIPYGLYRSHVYISANLAQKSGFSDEDLDLFWEAMINMFEHDRSAARGEMNVCGLYVFKHDSHLGNAPAKKLFDLVKVKKTSSGPARSFDDYTVDVDKESLPDNVELNVYME